ncbi:MAG: DNA repair protein RecO [Chitinophagaceae bacterium]|nr:MAG: DNA repair protein RecO [Chitinophagaceae bacterium]
MPDKLHHTKGIVLRTVKYGETSVIVTMFTELFGIQSYLVNGVRTSSKKGSGKANLFQPAALLDMVVYHNEQRQLHRIREFRWAYLYHTVFSDIRKNAVAVFMVELLTKCLKQPEANPELYAFTEDCFMQLDQAEDAVMANFPLFFALHLPLFFGFRVIDNHSDGNCFLDLQEGEFVPAHPPHVFFLEEKESAACSHLLKIMQPDELKEIKLHHNFRRGLLLALERYYALHIPDFGSLRTLPVLKEILS